VTGRVRSLETFSGNSLFLLHCWPDAPKSRPISSPSRPIANPSSVDCRQRHLHVWSDKQLLLQSNTLTRRVQSSKIPRPAKRKGHKPLRIATRLERNLFQKTFGLHLSYLVLSLTSVHHT
jgi:hypothetical protein